MLKLSLNIFNRYPILRYLFVGGFNTIMSLLVYYILVYFGANYLLATAITSIFGVIEGFILNSLIVFKHKVRWSGLLKYGLVYGLSFVLSLGIMFILVDTLAITIINYCLIKRFVFVI
jgi:putative flippase GtrA